MKKLIFTSALMLFSLTVFASGIHLKDSVSVSVGLNAGFGFSNKGDVDKTPFVMDMMFDSEICFPNNFIIAISMGYNYTGYSVEDGGYQNKVRQHIMRVAPLMVGVAIGDYSKFNIKIGPTLDMLMESKSILSYDHGKQQYITTLTDLPDGAYKFCALGLRVGVGIGELLEVYYQVGLTKHFEDAPTIHQITFTLPLRAKMKFPKYGYR